MADIQQTNDALIELQRHLEGLRTAAEHIDDAKKAVSTAVTVADTVRQDMAGVTRSSNALLERTGAVLTKLEAADLPAVSGNLVKILEQMRVTGADSTTKLIERLLEQVRAAASDATVNQILQRVSADGLSSAAKLDQILQQVRAAGADPTAKQTLEQVRTSDEKADGILRQVGATAERVDELASTLKWIKWTVVGIALGVVLLCCAAFVLHR